MISIFDIFSIGVGPSSSHTVGPMRAVSIFLKTLQRTYSLDSIIRVQLDLYGSLALTGKGHGIEKALLWGLMGLDVNFIDPVIEEKKLQVIYDTKTLELPDHTSINFNPKDCILYHSQTLPFHPNGMKCTAFFQDHPPFEKTYYSIGGGFVKEEGNDTQNIIHSKFPFQYRNAEDILYLTNKHNISIGDMLERNEETLRSSTDIKKRLWNLWETMDQSIEYGLSTQGILPGPLKLPRRAYDIYKKALSIEDEYFKMNAYAVAVSEENAAGHRIVTSPTNGAAGIIPATMKYYFTSLKGSKTGLLRFILTSAAIGILYKLNASISGAEVGCQGEVGVASSMAAGGMVAALNGSTKQILSASEIALEHYLGLVCDPVGGYVQIPCIERNAMGSVTAYNAARLALIRDSVGKVSLDQSINAMFEIGKDMKDVYRETGQGGLAKFVPCH